MPFTLISHHYLLKCAHSIDENPNHEHVETAAHRCFHIVNSPTTTYNVSNLETKGKDARSLKSAFRYGDQTFSQSSTRPGRSLPGTKEGTLLVTRRHAKALSHPGPDEIPGKMVGH